MDSAASSLPMGQQGNIEIQDASTLPANVPSHANLENGYEAAERSDEAEEMAIISSPDEVDESLMEFAISHVASRMKDPRTPAVEKATAMEEMDGGGFFESDPESPPATDQKEVLLGEDDSTDTLRNVNENQEPPRQASNKTGLSLGKLPSPNHEAPAVLPSPWHAGPKPLHVEKPGPQPALTGVFSSRTRSRSGGAEALKKFLPKGVGNFLGSNTSSGPKSPNRLNEMRPNRASTLFNSQSSSRTQSPERRTYQSIVTRPAKNTPKAIPLDIDRPRSIRRVTSDESLLYHSLSRASSLGDDTRFESQKEQVNSRAKAIRDSLQDRSSFRLPSMPTMPSMPSMPRVPSFSFNMNFLNASNVPARSRTNTDMVSDILSGNVKTRPALISNKAAASGLAGAAASQPKAAVDPKPINDGQLPSSLQAAMEELTGDVVIMGGYRGSILRATKTKRQVWVPVKVGLNIRKVDLEVGLEPEDEERMEETIYPSGMLTNIGPVDISRRLFKRLNECENAKSGKLRVWDYGYDWRLSPHLLARKLTKFLEGLPSNQPSKDGSVQAPGGALVIAHSLGGLITRHVVNHRPELFSGVIYAGVPQACVNILGPLRNGDAVLLSQRVLTAQVNFTLRTSFVLLPEDGACFIDIKTREKYPVDFFNIDDWIKYRWSPCTDPPLPPKNPVQQGGLGSLLNMSSSLLSLPTSVKSLGSASNPPPSTSPPSKTTRAAEVLKSAEGGTDRTLAPQMGGMSSNTTKSNSQSISTHVTLPRPAAIKYLTRTLAEIKTFKSELHHRPHLEAANRYPPFALIYGKSIPTCAGAKVDGRDGIACADSYDNLAFGSGDGVCLAKEAMLPVGYRVVKGGRVGSERGHVTLLGDLEAVGRAMVAVARGRGKGIGLGLVGGE
ncbi:alpha/beta-Hydrolase [Glarea lozoyensis ATCC 20868]|uniref:Alpha/beta-Hydrolase n=1 Tax=Glarea lozoyensis (strain ATCC 20868 / MF5171) TaxID=1116229 RepID=S3DXW4_GLAL2|nr:alpha/beta-Hydrolase [Glarea lozoyensis ATCC 20868]EPE36751.1 alpha/beta-Hydrolase [Glarea lozoyensis ATCC 20868]